MTETKAMKPKMMKPKAVTVDDAIAILSQIAETDPVAMSHLLACRVECNKALIDHPTVQVRSDNGERGTVSILGIINGLFGVDEDEWGYIAAIIDDDGRCTGFCRAIRIGKPGIDA